nr:MAG TPA: hypothetical protein [Caudoviricetes sp.]
MRNASPRTRPVDRVCVCASSYPNCATWHSAPAGTSLIFSVAACIRAEN